MTTLIKKSKIELPKYLQDIDEQGFISKFFGVHKFDPKFLSENKIEIESIFKKYVSDQSTSLGQGKKLKQIRVIKCRGDHNGFFILRNVKSLENLTTELSKYGYVTHREVCTEEEAQQVLKAKAVAGGKLFGYLILGHGSAEKQEITIQKSYRINAKIITENHNKEAKFIMFKSCSATNQLFKNGKMTSLGKELAMETLMTVSGPKLDIYHKLHINVCSYDREKDSLIMHTYRVDNQQKDLTLTFDQSVLHYEEKELIKLGEKLANDIREEFLKKRTGEGFISSISKKQKEFAQFVSNIFIYHNIPCDKILKWIEKFCRGNPLAIEAIKLYVEKKDQLGKALAFADERESWTIEEKRSMNKKFDFLDAMMKSFKTMDSHPSSNDFLAALRLNAIVSKDVESGYRYAFTCLETAYCSGLKKSKKQGEKMLEEALKHTSILNRLYHPKEAMHFEWLCFQEVCEKLAKNPTDSVKNQYQYLKKLLYKYLKGDLLQNTISKLETLKLKTNNATKEIQSLNILPFQLQYLHKDILGALSQKYINDLSPETIESIIHKLNKEQINNLKPEQLKPSKNVIRFIKVKEYKEIGSLNCEQLHCIDEVEINNIESSEILIKLSPRQILFLNKEKLRQVASKLPSDKLAYLDNKKLRKVASRLSPDQLANLKDERLYAIADKLSPDQLANLKDEQLSKIVSRLSSDQLSSLKKKQLRKVAHKLSSDQLASFKDKQLRKVASKLSPDQLANLKDEQLLKIADKIPSQQLFMTKSKKLAQPSDFQTHGLPQLDSSNRENPLKKLGQGIKDKIAKELIAYKLSNTALT